MKSADNLFDKHRGTNVHDGRHGVVFAVDDHAEARREAAAIGGIYWYRHRRDHYDRLHF